MIPEITPPFGTYALSTEREAWRLKADGYKANRIGRLMISRARKKAIAGHTGPFDIDVASGVKARLYPEDNRCEKRAFAGVQVWDEGARGALKSAIETSSDKTSPDRRFVFLDVGANVGLYSLYAQAYANDAGRDIRIIAFEPGMETCGRLEANISASGANVEIIRAAISDKPGTGYLSRGENNRGEAKLDKRSDKSEEVVIDTLPRIARTLGLTYIDAMKVDIEGQDFKAMTAFFNDAPLKLHPNLLILETGRTEYAPLLELCKAQNYKVDSLQRSNAILSKGLSS